MSGESYRVQENTGNLAHPSIEDVIDLALARAADPRPPEHPNAYFDQYLQNAANCQVALKSGTLNANGDYSPATPSGGQSGSPLTSPPL